jgi:dCTP deaminase
VNCVLLSDIDIAHELAVGTLSIAPWHMDMLQPASVELHLGKQFVFYKPSDIPLDPLNLQLDEMIDNINLMNPGEYVDLQPGQCVLAHTEEIIKLSGDLAARVEGKSSLGRLFLLVHATAGFIDPGFHGQLTLEISNPNCRPIRLTPGMRIAQLGIFRMSSPANLLYGETVLGSHYQGQIGVVLPKSLRP